MERFLFTLKQCSFFDVVHHNCCFLLLLQLFCKSAYPRMGIHEVDLINFSIFVCKYALFKKKKQNKTFSLYGRVSTKAQYGFCVTPSLTYLL